ncbi:MAG: hypothetical protein LIP02_12440 [Bacteroidales bacterium]|nr:hypothetical protein [Bacteroidales bacterium]
MKTDNDYIKFDEQVDRYLRKQMTPAEESEFKALLARDPELKSRARTTAMMIRAMRQVTAESKDEGQAIIDSAKEMSEEQFRKEMGFPAKKSQLSVRPFWPRFVAYAAAACVLGFIAVGIVRFQIQSNAYRNLGNSTEMLTDLYGPDKGATRGEEDTPVEQLAEMERLFVSVEQGTDLQGTVKSLKALYNASLQKGSELSDFRVPLAWNLSIAYLKIGRGHDAIPLLEDIIDRTEFIQDRREAAQQLLDRINQI